MTARVEAAAAALWQVHPLTRENVRAATRRSLDAADTILFSTEAVERVARVLVEVGRFGVPWEDASDRDRSGAIELSRAVIAALRSTA